MIGHYLLTLDVAGEDRILERKFAPMIRGAADRSCGCLVMNASGNPEERNGVNRDEWYRGSRVGELATPGWQYEYACERFGTVRVNAAIRNRILSNRARRVLSQVPVMARSAEEPR